MEQAGTSIVFGLAKCKSGDSTLNSKLITATQRGRQKFVSLAVLRNFKIPLPPLAEQRDIVDQLSEQMRTVEQTRKALEAQRESITKLPTALLRRAFKGEL